MKSDFDRENVIRWFGDNFTCWWCSKNHANCGHHILGRGGKYKSSLLNYGPLNNTECHINIHPILKRRENKKMLLQKTMTYLLERGYDFTDDDKMFIFENSEFYYKE